MTSREQILEKLRGRKRPFPHIIPPANPQHMSPLSGDTESLLARFIQEAEALSAIVHQPADHEAAVDEILSIVGYDTSVLAWDFDNMPLPLLSSALTAANVKVADPADHSVRVGISGADAALAATGSLVVVSGNGRFRTTSLLPPVHIAVITPEQIMPNLESWAAKQSVGTQQSADPQAEFRQSSNIVVISGASRTADIAMQLILGMHGPGELHIIIANANQ